MVGQQIEGNFFLPDAVSEHMVLIADGRVEEDGRLNSLSVFGCSYIYIEVQRIFSIGVDAEGKWTLDGFFDGLAVTENFNQTHSQYF